MFVLMALINNTRFFQSRMPSRRASLDKIDLDEHKSSPLPSCFIQETSSRALGGLTLVVPGQISNPPDTSSHPPEKQLNRKSSMSSKSLSNRLEGEEHRTGEIFRLDEFHHKSLSGSVRIKIPPSYHRREKTSSLDAGKVHTLRTIGPSIEKSSSDASIDVCRPRRPMPNFQPKIS